MRIILLECSMDLRRTLRYKVGILSDLAIFTALLLVFLYSNTGASFQEEYRTENGKALLLLGYTAWTLASTAISVTSQQIHAEVQRGTFYLKLNSGLPLPLLYLGDFLSAGILQTGVIFVYTLAGQIIFQVSYGLNLEIVFSLLLGSLGMYGMGLLVAGLALLYKRVSSLLFLLQLFLLFVTDTVPTADSITAVTNLIPLTRCNAVIRNSFLGTHSPNDLLLLCISSAAAFAIGCAVFHCCFRRAKRKGVLLLY